MAKRGRKSAAELALTDIPVVDVFRRGQGVFGIAVGPVQQELEGELHRLFPESPPSTTGRAEAH